MTRDKRLRGRGIRKHMKRLRRISNTWDKFGYACKKCSSALKDFADELKGVHCDEWEARDE